MFASFVSKRLGSASFPPSAQNLPIRVVMFLSKPHLCISPTALSSRELSSVSEDWGTSNRLIPEVDIKCIIIELPEYPLQKNWILYTSSWNKVFRVIFLLAWRLREGSYSGNNGCGHEYDGYDGPDNTPALWRTPIPLSKNARIGCVDFSKDEIIALSKECD